MTEDELYAGITEALTLAGWRWMHIIRSDGVMTGTGASGWPDLVAVHDRRAHLLIWELKAARGQATADQWAWIGPLAVVATKLSGAPAGYAHFDARVLYPADYDAALSYIVGKTDRMIAA